MEVIGICYKQNIIMNKYNILLIEPNNNAYGEEALEKPLGGSETIFIFLVRYLQKRSDISLEVFYRNSGDFKEFVLNKKYDLVISYRNPAPLFQVQGKMNVVYLQDLPSQESVAMLNTLFSAGKINKMIFLSHFQKEMYLRNMPQIEEGRHVLMFENGLDLSLFDETIKKKNEFIYASAPNRGLETLLSLWSEIHDQLPDYILKIAGSTKMYNVDSNNNNNKETRDIDINKEREKLLEIGNELYSKAEKMDGVKLLGGLSHKQLIKEMESSKSLLYPSTYPETCCHVLNCALHAGAVPVISSVGAITEKVANSENGIIVNGDPTSDEFKKQYIENVLELVKSNRIERMIIVNRGNYLAWDMERLVNRLITQLLKFNEFEGDNVKVLGIICSLNDRKENTKVNFKNLIWYAPVDMITDEYIGLPLDQARTAAANVAMYMKADWLLFLDNDIYVDKNFLMDMIKKAEDTNSDVVVANYPYKENNNLIPTTRVKRILDNKAINCYDVSEEEINNKEKYKFIVAGLGAILISTNVLKKIGRPQFRTQIISHNTLHLGKQTGEDSYFYQECKAIGAKIWLSTEVPIIHVDNKTGNIFGKKEHIELIRPQINNITKHKVEPQINNYKSESIMGIDSRFDNIIKYTNKYIIKGSILDIGCGDGFIADCLKKDFKITKVDIKNGKDIIVHDLEKPPYPFENEVFDGIICSEVLEHLYKPETVINESYRILKENGIMIVTVPNFNNINNIINRHQNIVYYKDNILSSEHIRHYTLDSLNKIIDNKFEIVKVVGNSPHMNPFFINARKVLNDYITKDDTVNIQMYIDNIIGECFPTECMGIMIIMKKLK